MRTRDVDADTVRRRALEDARGHVIREGVSYRADRTITWKIRRSLRGRINQVDFVIDGVVWRTGALQHAERALSTGRWPGRKRP